MDHISRIAIFLEVVKKQSFSGAARNLGLTGPAVSKQVQALEDQLGVRLLNRTTRQVTLTEEGALYNERARKALEDLHEAEQQLHDLKENPTGPLRINAPMSFGLAYLTRPFAEFADRYPNVRMDITFDDREVDMLAEGYDVLIRIGALDDSSLIARYIAACPILPCASPEFITQYGTPSTPTELAKLPAAVSTHRGLMMDWQFRTPTGATEHIQLAPVLTANTANALTAACVKGVGFAVLPIFAIAKHLKDGTLVQLLPGYKVEPERGIYAIFPQNRYLSTKTRLFVDWMSEIGKQFPWSE